MGCVLALSLTLSIQAQNPKSPPGNYYSAKDFEWAPPLPFNPYPGLPFAEVGPGMYVVDDTKLPDTPEQAAARKQRQEAEERAKTIAANPLLAKAAQEATEEAVRLRRESYEREFGRWRHGGLQDEEGRPTNRRGWLESKRVAAAAKLPALRRAEKDAQDAARAWAVRTGSPETITLPGNRVARLTRMSHGEAIYLAPCSGVAADTISTDEVWPGGASGLNLAGTGRVIGLWDEYDVRVSHYEFGGTQTRAVQRDSTGSLGWHATAVAGIMGAVGLNWGPPYYRVSPGMSQNTGLWAYDFNYDAFTEMNGAALEGLRLSNHSYAPNAGWRWDSGIGYWRWWGSITLSQNEDWKFGFYATESATIDQHARDFPEYLTVWAAGNDQAEAPAGQPLWHLVRNAQGAWDWSSTTRAADGDQGGFDTMSAYAGSKNVLSVGAVQDIVGGYGGAGTVVLAGFSSCGPTDDGRVKPDIVANGVMLNTPANDGDNLYWIDEDFVTGTSFSAPGVTGSINLLAERHGQLRSNAALLLACTLKGLVIHTADEAGANPGPDFRHGWGLMNTLHAVELLNADAASTSRAHLKEVLLENGKSIEFPVVSSGATPLRVTICWADPAGPVDAFASVDPVAARLVNDVDLRIIGPTGGTSYPWVLNPDLAGESAALRSAPATTGDDARNNVEQVLIASPTAGTHTVRVTHKGTLQNQEAQWVCILISGNVAQPKPELRITNQTVTPGGDFALSWPAVVGQRYRVQYRNTVEGSGWTDIGPEVSAALTNVTVELLIDQPQRFFRIAEVE